MSERIEKSLSSVLVALRTHCNALGDEGVINPDRVRLTVSARVAEAPELVKPIAEGGKGLSQRQAAKALGISETQLRRDLRRNGAKSAPKGRTIAEAILTAVVLSRALIVLGADGIETDPHWLKLWSLSRMAIENARRVPDDARDDPAVWVRKREIISKLEENHNEIDGHIRRNWRPKESELNDEPVLGDILTRVGEMGDVEFWTSLKEHFPELAAFNLGEAP